jgi:hypothetical protein
MQLGPELEGLGRPSKPEGWIDSQVFLEILYEFLGRPVRTRTGWLDGFGPASGGRR